MKSIYLLPQEHTVRRKSFSKRQKVEMSRSKASSWNNSSTCSANSCRPCIPQTWRHQTGSHQREQFHNLHYVAAAVSSPFCPVTPGSPAVTLGLPARPGPHCRLRMKPIMLLGHACSIQRQTAAHPSSPLVCTPQREILSPARDVTPWKQSSHQKDHQKGRKRLLEPSVLTEGDKR